MMMSMFIIGCEFRFDCDCRVVPQFRQMGMRTTKKVLLIFIACSTVRTETSCADGVNRVGGVNWEPIVVKLCNGFAHAFW
jgi:hypothetical protein